MNRRKEYFPPDDGHSFTYAFGGRVADDTAITEARMYHAIVKRIALQNFLRVNQKDYAPILKGCSSDVHHQFGGHHALGGERHDREALRRWFERLGRLAPTLQLKVHDVWVKGGPWNTTVIIRWSAVQDLPDGSL
jgi:ketosteroid isomerase-like protein